MADADDGMSRFFGIAGMLVGGALLAGLGMVVVRLLSGGGEGPKQVWSSEHGHYHAVGGGGDHAAGPAPGKVWSEEHQHWHDAAAKPGASMEAPSPSEGALQGLRAAQLEGAARRGAGAPVEEGQ